MHEGEGALGGEDEDPRGLLRAVDDLVAARGPLREDGDVAWGELALAVRPPQCGPARDGDEPLLAADLVVVRPGLLARRELVDGAADELRAERTTDVGAPMQESFDLLGRLGLAAEQVQRSSPSQ